MTIQTRLLVARQLIQRLSKRPRRGFTLIELLVVVVIIGILASIALPSFVGAQDKARNASVQANVNTVRLGLEQFSTDNNGSYPAAGSQFASSTAGLLTNNYLPGNKVPRSPWCKSTQSAELSMSGDTSAANLAGGTPMATLPQLAAAAGSGKITDPPAAATDYGVIEYDQDPNSQTYIVVGVGKRNKDSIITAHTTNNGN